MSRRFRTLICLTSLCISLLARPAAPSVAAQDAFPWRQLAGPGGRLTHLAASSDGAELFAVAVGGVNRREDATQWFDTGQPALADALYRSRDLGRTWTAATNDLPPGRITALLVHPSTGDVFIGLNAEAQGGLWRWSATDGAWRWLDLGRQDLLVRSLAVSADGRTLFAGVIENGETPLSLLLRSTDSGGTWVGSVVLRGQGALVAVTPHPAVPERVFAAGQNGALERSTDSGQSWTPVANDAAGRAPALLSFRPDQPALAWQVLSADGGLGVQRSRDGGLTWSVRPDTGLPASGLPASGLPEGARGRTLTALAGRALLLNTSLGSYRSVDEGRTWQPLEGSLSAGEVSAFLTLPGGDILAATGYGLFLSRDEGAIWQAWGEDLPLNSKIFGLITHSAHPNQILAFSDNRLTWERATPPTVLLSGDGGARWTPLATGLAETQLTAWAADPSDPARLYVAASDAIYVSADGGVGWQATAIAPSTRTALAVARDGATAYLSGSPALRSTDRGAGWQALAVAADGLTAQTVTALAVDPRDARHVWAGSEAGVLESRDGGDGWTRAGLEGQAVRWLAVAAEASGADGASGVRLYAGIPNDGIYRLDAGGAWVAAATGLPAGSTVLAFLPDERTPGMLWATRDGGGVYRSLDWGDTWENAGGRLGDNLGLALAIDYATPDGVLLGTANSGIYALGGASAAPAASPTAPAPAASATATPGAGVPGVDARIEVVWPHNFAPVQEAKQANVGVRLFAAGALRPPACGWRPKVVLWQASGTDPIARVREAEQRTVDGQPFPYWDINDVDVSTANNPNRKLYFLVKVEGVVAATSIWAHAADARTFFPTQDAPSGIAGSAPEAVDARVQIVWPHDGMGNEQPVDKAPLANVVVAFFKHGTRLSVPPTWQPPAITLYGAWNQEMSRPLAMAPRLQIRQSGAITYPVWEFDNIPVGRAAEAGSKLYLWAEASGVETYPTLWAHGADSRTFFPAQDEPIQGCTP